MSHTTSHPTITATEGQLNHTLVLSVDGLCVAIVDPERSFNDAADDLQQVMNSCDSPSGSLLLAPNQSHGLSMQERKVLANRGISIERSDTKDLQSAARQILTEFWEQHQFIEREFQAFEQQE